MNKRVEETNLEKYGVKRPLQNVSIQKKTKQTNLTRYGVENVFQNAQIQSQIRQTCLSRYGVDNAKKSTAINQKATKTRRISQFQHIKEAWKDYVIPLFTEDDYIDCHSSYRWKCVKCGNEWEQHIHKSYKNGEIIYFPRCLKCYPYVEGFSYLEKEVLDFIKSIYHSEVIENDRKLLSGKELDIVIPQKKIAIEFNGIYYHSEACKTEMAYHLHKTISCEVQGYQLVHIFENEWISQRPIIEDKIKSLLDIYDERIYARCCEIREIDSKTSNEFLEMNHLQGKDNASIRFGLFYQKELVSVMTFGKPRFNKHYDFELIRFASKLGCQVIGGFSKLLKNFERAYPDTSVISYADRRYSKGNVYLKNGFKLKETSLPNYFYTRGKELYSRYQCQKNRLKALLKDKFNPLLSETENMLANGYSKIFDCGNLVFTKENLNAK